MAESTTIPNVINLDKSNQIEKATDVSAIIQDVKVYLSGVVLKHEQVGEQIIGDKKLPIYEWKYVKNTEVKPLLNDMGVQSVLQTIKINVNNITSLSNINDVIVRREARHALLTITSDLFRNWNRYDLNPSNFDKIIGDLHTLIINGIYKALNEGERRFHSSNTQETFLHTDAPKEQGLLGKVFKNPFSNQ